MKNKVELKISDIICFLKDGLMQKEKMTEEQAGELISRFSVEKIIELYSKILEDVNKKRGKNNE